MSGSSPPTAPHRPGVLAERLAEHLRNSDIEALRAENALAAVLPELLTALGWHGDWRRVIEALPHFADRFDIVDLRHVLLTLGFESDPIDRRPADLPADLYPLLFVGDDGRVLIVADTEAGDSRCFDGTDWEDGTGRLTTLAGRTFVFTNVNASNPLQQADRQTDWFTRVFRRFRLPMAHLVGITLLLNLLAIVIPLFIMLVYDNIIGSKTTDALPYMIAGVAIALLCELALRHLRAKSLGLIAARLDYLIGTATFGQLLKLPPLLIERSTLNAQLQKLKQFDAVRDFFTGANATILLDLPFVMISIAVIALLAGPIALIPITMLVVYAIVAMLIAPRVKRQMTATGIARAAREQILLETVDGMRELKALGMERDWENRFRELSSSATTAGHRVAMSQALVQTVAHTVTMLAGIAVLAAGAYGVMDAALSVGALIAIMALAWRVLGPIQGAFLAWMRVDQIAGGIRQINQLMSLDAENLSSSSGLLLPSVGGEISFERVSFRYGPTSDPALLGVSCHIPAGSFVAVAGENGSGKSTLIKLIAGMYRPQGGSVTIDGMDIRQFNPVDLRRMIAYVPQQPTLFHGTIAQNLRLKDSLATDDAIEAALDAAGILDAVQRLPEGIHTRVGDAETERLPTALVRGLCLARAFLRNSSILLLDEPGTTLDSASDQHLMAQLEKVRGNMTVVLVTHRPSHIRLADKALLMHDGALAHAGTPEECLSLMDRQVRRQREQSLRAVARANPAPAS